MMEDYPATFIALAQTMDLPTSGKYGAVPQDPDEKLEGLLQWNEQSHPQHELTSRPSSLGAVLWSGAHVVILFMSAALFAGACIKVSSNTPVMRIPDGRASV